MRVTDLITETLLSLTSNKVRSGLTILGIVVGIASVIAMISIGRGSQASIESSISSAGANSMTVMPASPGQQGGGMRRAAAQVDSLTREDAEALAELDLVAGASPESQSGAQLASRNENVNAMIMGLVAESLEVKGYEIASGNYISERDDTAFAKVLVLGSETAVDLFGEGVEAVGQRVRANGMVFTVIGVLAEKGTSGFTNIDSAAIIPLSTMQRYMTGSEYVSTISITVADQNRMDEAESLITSTMLERHVIADETMADFRIMNMADLLESVSAITGTFTTLLAGIASISLLVGGIGIMNMMLTTVTERTREIGLRKAIGASDGAISAQFLAESVTLTLIGGAIGVAAGWGIGALAGKLLGMQAIVSLEAVALAAGVCAFIGIVFGFYPARRAAKLSPIDALRYQ